MPTTSRPTISVIMPAYNAAHLLPLSLPPLVKAAGADRVVVIDPGSTDDTAEVARSYGVRVMRLPERAGPARARNEGVALVDSDVVLFIDSDCVAHDDVVEIVAEAFRDPALVSLTGSYDESPPEQNFFSQYMNLRHCYTHHNAQTEGAGFWAGCGAIRRDAFNQVGGFNVERYPMPMIEDIDLGMQLKPLGPTRLDPKMQVKHLKKWTMRSVIETDLKCRAIPWVKLILESGELPNDLNLRTSQRVAAALAPFALAGLVTAPVAAAVGAWPVAAVAAAPVVASLALHADVIGFMARVRGVGFAVPFWAFHQVHLSYSAATFAALTVMHRVKGAERTAV